MYGYAAIKKQAEKPIIRPGAALKKLSSGNKGVYKQRPGSYHCLAENLPHISDVHFVYKSFIRATICSYLSESKACNFLMASRVLLLGTGSVMKNSPGVIPKYSQI